MRIAAELIALAIDRDGPHISKCAGKSQFRGSITHHIQDGKKWAMLWYNVGENTHVVKMEVNN